MLSVRTLSPTLLRNYHFLSPADALRPYVGAGINDTRFTSAHSSLASDVVYSAGVSYQF